jgi:hypothetical protein
MRANLPRQSRMSHAVRCDGAPGLREIAWRLALRQAVSLASCPVT